MKLNTYLLGASIVWTAIFLATAMVHHDFAADVETEP
jgi:hypothetical protein